MTYKPDLGSSVTDTKMRTPKDVSQFSGMCSTCASNCLGTCEIGRSAVLGDQAIYPYKADINQFASEKNYPFDFSHFNINGRVFGVSGANETHDEVTFPKADVSFEFGKTKKTKLTMPIILPAMAKLNWKDYYSGAALAGVMVVIGEDVVGKDKDLVIKDGKVANSPLIKKMIQQFRKYYRGYGDIILQANVDDENLGVLDYAISELGVTSVEIKFGQAAKGIQGMGQVKDIDKARKLQEKGYLIYPNPNDKNVIDKYKNEVGPIFQKIGKLPLWDEDYLVKRVKELRNLGAKHVCFKTGPFDPKDLIRLIKIASIANVDLITFDGAGGGSGNSPTKMMNEWGIPTANLESLLYKILKKMDSKGFDLPQVAITGGLVMEDDVYKALALGGSFIQLVGIGRGAMAAAFAGHNVGKLIDNNSLPESLSKYGNTKKELFKGIRQLKEFYGQDALEIPAGAIGVYSFLDRVSTGLKQFMALNRKFNLSLINRDDIYPLTNIAESVSGIPQLHNSLTSLLEEL